MKVLNAPDPKAWRESVTCDACNAVLEVEVADFSRITDDQREVEFAHTRCVNCGHELRIDASIIPRVFHRFIKNKGSHPQYG